MEWRVAKRLDLTADLYFPKLREDLRVETPREPENRTDGIGRPKNTRGVIFQTIREMSASTQTTTTAEESSANSAQATESSTTDDATRVEKEDEEIQI